MSKYDALYDTLRGESRRTIHMSFEEVEEILGFVLPRTARERPQWWANEENGKTGHVQCRAWLDAGYRTANVDLEKESVRFSRL
jgi:hypothetical protein